MKKVFILTIIVCSFLSLNMTGQEQSYSIKFEKGQFQNLLKKAKQSDKLIFIDCYTSWCAPCKWMDQNVFIKKDIASFYNSSFINVKLDMEKGEGPELGKRYNVSSYPTYLFINAKGDVVHRAASKMTAEEFLVIGKSAIDPEKSTGLLAKKFEAGTITLEEELNYAIALKKMRMSKADKIRDNITSKVNDAWYQSLSGWKLIETFVFSDQDELFNKLTKFHKFYVDLVGKTKVNHIYIRAIQRNMYQSTRDLNEKLFFRQLDSLKKLNATARDLAIIHSGYYIESNNAEMYIKTTNDYVENFLQNDQETIAFLARNASQRAKDNLQILTQAGVLITKAYNMENPSYGTVSTYAQIQSLLGNKAIAIKAAERAVKMAESITSKIKTIALRNLEEIKAR